jgi:hypothetical protein
MTGDRGRHEPDRAGTGDEDILAEDREGESGVNGVAERVEDRGDLLGSTPGQWCQMFVIGRTTYSANAPSRPTPSPIEWAHRWRRPARQWRQRPQTTWPSPETRSPGEKSVTFEPTSTISPTNSWPTTRGGTIVFAAHGSHDSMWRSVPQIPVRWTRMRTSLMPTAGSGTSMSRRPGRAAVLTRASIGPASVRLRRRRVTRWRGCLWRRGRPRWPERRRPGSRPTRCPRSRSGHDLPAPGRSAGRGRRRRPTASRSR